MAILNFQCPSVTRITIPTRISHLPNPEMGAPKAGARGEACVRHVRAAGGGRAPLYPLLAAGPD